jgi:hypothetical protein
MAETSPGFFSKGGTGSDLLGYVPLVGGALQSLFGKSEEEIRRERIAEARKQNEMYRQMAANRVAQLKSGGVKDISSETATQSGRAQSDVGRRAAASGRVGDTEAMLLPTVSNINESGGKRMEDTLRYYDTQAANVQNQFDQNAMQIEQDAAARPIEVNPMEQIVGYGTSALKQSNYDRYLDAMAGLDKTPAPYSYSRYDTQLPDWQKQINR